MAELARQSLAVNGVSQFISARLHVRHDAIAHAPGGIPLGDRCGRVDSLDLERVVRGECGNGADRDEYRHQDRPRDT